MKIQIFPVDFFFFKHKKAKTREPKGRSLLHNRDDGTKSSAEIARQVFLGNN